MSGYSIRLTAFLPCGKSADAHVFAQGALTQLRETIEMLGLVEVSFIDEFKPNRKVPALAEAAAVAAQDGAAGADSAPSQSPTVAPAAADLNMPSFLDRKVPR